jgi:outer membrane protein assembly factor BamD
LRRTLLVVLTGLFLIGATRCDAQIFHKKKKENKSTSAENTAEPDKILYSKAMEDIKHGRHEVGRLNLQTLINTYPDSEYLAKAKLTIADSYYKEGGTANMTQAIQGYKDFIVFFPFMPEAAYAQLQVAMAHYRQMEKPDRDRSQARDAEDEFQTFLSKYANDPLAPKAEQHLREVQELLAEGDFRIGYYYYLKGDKKAADSRLRSLTNRYPLYSKSDRALWMLGNLWEGTEKKEFASTYYARIVRDYPLSNLVPDAKSRLKALGAPVPQPDPKAVAWMTAEQNAPRERESFIKKPLALVKTGPGREMSVAAKTGTPTMTPESESDSGVDVLRGGPPRTGSTTGIVATVSPGTSGGSASAETTDSTGGSANSNGTSTSTDGSQPPASDGANGNSTNGASADGTGTATAGSPAKADGNTANSAQPADGQKADGTTTQDGSQPATDSGKGNKESTSKKKKGLRKIVPW